MATYSPSLKILLVFLSVLSFSLLFHHPPLPTHILTLTLVVIVPVQICILVFFVIFFIKYPFMNILLCYYIYCLNIVLLTLNSLLSEYTIV